MEKKNLIFIVICLIAVCKVDSQEERFLKMIDDCARELNIKDAEKYHKPNWAYLEELLGRPSDDKTCMFACFLRKRSDLGVSTFAEGLLYFIGQIYSGSKRGIPIKMVDVLDIIKDCFEEEQEECEIAKCIVADVSEQLQNL